MKLQLSKNIINTQINEWQININKITENVQILEDELRDINVQLKGYTSEMLQYTEKIKVCEHLRTIKSN